MTETVKLVEIFKVSTQYGRTDRRRLELYQLRDIYINPHHIVYFKENKKLGLENQASRLVEGMLEDIKFTRVILNTSGASNAQLDIVGSPVQFAEKINGG